MSKLTGALWRRSGKRKDSMQLRLWNLKICIEKVDAKCCLAEMTLIMASLPLAYVFFNVCLHSCSFPLRLDWRKSESSVDGEPQGNWKWNSNSRDVAASSPPPVPPCCQSAALRACSQAKLSPKFQSVPNWNYFTVVTRQFSMEVSMF